MCLLGNYKKILTFFAHPDDETLGAGATIHKLITRGDDVYIAIPTASGTVGRDNRRSCRKAMDILGVKKNRVHLGDFPDNEMDARTLLKLIKWLEGIIAEVQPDTIITHHRFCTNIDHQYCHNATVVATRPSIYSHIQVLCAEIPSSTGYLRPTGFEPNFYVQAAKEDIDKKLEAMDAYTSEVRLDPNPRSKNNLRALAKIRGAEAGFYFAEAFMLLRGFYD